MKQEKNSRPLETRHVSVTIDRPPDQVYAFASKVENLAHWASGLKNMMATVRLVERNPFGLLDHDVVLESGETVHNPMRVVPNGGGGSEVMFTLFRRPEMSPEQFKEDASTVQGDLATLKKLIEQTPASEGAEGAVHAHHAIDYIELTVDDVAAATRFYGAAFGWRFTPTVRITPAFKVMVARSAGSAPVNATRTVARWSCSTATIWMRR